MVSYNDNFCEQLHNRIVTTDFQQFAPENDQPTTDSITGREIRINRARSQRKFELRPSPSRDGNAIIPVEECLFCQGRTPSTLFYLSEAESKEGGTVSLCAERHSINSALASFTECGIDAGELSQVATIREIEMFFAMLDATAPHVAEDMKRRQWLMRAFLNLTPSRVRRHPPSTGEAKCAVIASHPEYHYLYLDELPPRVVASLIEGWKVWEAYSIWRNRVTERGEFEELRALPFINGGKRPEAGQSVYCFHSQVFIAKVPEIYFRIKNRRVQQSKCGVCEILEAKNNGVEPKFEVYANSTMTLCLHPAPPRNLSFIAAPLRQDGHCISHIRELDNSDTADVLQRAIAIYRRLLGSVPGYNVILRSGPEVKHLHIEIIPKTGTNVPAGYEALTEEIIITQDPEETAKLLRRRYA